MKPELPNSHSTPGGCPFPLGIMSFDRPALLNEVLTALRAQTVRLDDANVYLFQDAPLSGDDVSQFECIATFARHFPNGRVFYPERNLGVAFNFDRAERFFFGELKTDAALFFEDDLVPGPFYLEALLDLAGFALREPLVAYAGVYGEHRASLADQLQRRTEIVQLREKWGFVLTKRQWQLQRGIVDGYLDAIRGAPYRDRNRDGKVERYFASLGFKTLATSQDAAKDIASHALGTTKVMTYACFGKYVGRVGIHQNEENYLRSGYQNTVLFPGPVPDFAYPPRARLQDYVEQGRRDWALQPGGGSTPAGSAAPAETSSRGTTSGSNDALRLGTKPNAPSLHKRLMQTLYGADVWSGFEPASGKPDIQGWNGDHPVLRRLMEAPGSKIVVDIGIWKGQSTLTMAAAMKALGVEGVVIAVDTFLGSAEHWQRTPRLFDRTHGFPDLYKTFLVNVVQAGLEDYVIPMPQTSIGAASILRNLQIFPSVVHLDGAHDYAGVLRDCEEYWSLLQPGGVLIGDDYHETWPGVVQAAREFSARFGQPLVVEPPKWILQKP